MMKNILKGIGLLCMLCYSIRTSAQEDSTDLNFYAVDYFPQTAQDSIDYGVSDLVKLRLEFEVDDPEDFDGVILEIHASNESNLIGSIYTKTYTKEELINLNFLDGNSVEADLLIGYSVYRYTIYCMILDPDGHQKISLTKNLILE